MKHYLFVLCLLSLFMLIFTSANQNLPLCSSSRCPSISTDGELIFEFGDVNGDGKTDYIQRPSQIPFSCAQDGTYLMLSDGNNGFTQISLGCYLNFRGGLTKLVFGDFNGDGKQEILRRELTNFPGTQVAEILIYKSKDKFDRIPLDATELAFGKTYVGDFNGDCKDDFLHVHLSFRAQITYVYLSKGDGSFKRFVVSGPDPLTQLTTSTNVFIGDFNGDGMDDIFRQEKFNLDNDDQGTGTVLLSNGDGTFTVKVLPESLNLKGDYYKLTMGDFNGDCRTDIIKQSVCITRTSQGISSGSSSSSSSDDINSEMVGLSLRSWVDWTEATLSGNTPGSAQGTLTIGGKVVNVHFSGAVDENSVTDGSFLEFGLSSTYFDGPTGKYRDFIGLTGTSADFENGPPLQTITFSEAVVDPVMAVYSMGSVITDTTVYYDFGGVEIEILCFGNTQFGFGSLDVEGTMLKGYEGSGIVRLKGVFTTLSFRYINQEHWHGFTIGASALADGTANLCPPVSLLLADKNADFTPIPLPDDFNIQGEFTSLYASDFNCDRRSDLLIQENGQRPGSDVTKIENLLSTRHKPYFTKAHLFDPCKITNSFSSSHIHVADFNGDTRSDFAQLWGRSCIEVFYSPLEGKCKNDRCKCGVHGSGSESSNGINSSDNSDSNDYSSDSSIGSSESSQNGQDKSSVGEVGSSEL